jgi:hypothetical protein
MLSTLPVPRTIPCRALLLLGQSSLRAASELVWLADRNAMRRVWSYQVRSISQIPKTVTQPPPLAGKPEPTPHGGGSDSVIRQSPGGQISGMFAFEQTFHCQFCDGVGAGGVWPHICQKHIRIGWVVK